MKRLGFALALITTLLVMPGTVGADSVLKAGGVSISPAIQDRALGPQDKSVSFNFQLYNYTDKVQTIEVSAQDFTTLNQTGGLAFQGSDSTRVSSGHGLSSILKLSKKIVKLPANGQVAITAQITNVETLAPGGHYGAVLARVIPAADTSQIGNKVAINQVVSSLIFVETAGQGSKTITLFNPPVNNVSFTLPRSVNLVFKSTGNTQAVPRGVVQIVHGDELVSQGIINENSSLILPGSTRLLPVQLVKFKQPAWPGMYTLRVQYRYEGALGITTYEKRFLYINLVGIVFATATLLAVSLTIYQLRHKIWRAYRPYSEIKRIVRRLVITPSNKKPRPPKR